MFGDDRWLGLRFVAGKGVVLAVIDMVNRSKRK